MIIAVIGGIGAGKSTVLSLLSEKYHMTICRTDDVAKGFYFAGNPVFSALIDLLGTEILTPDEKAIDKEKLAARIFPDHALLEAVNGIVHPAVWQYVTEQIEKNRQEGSDLVIETALPTPAFLAACDSVWLVHADREARIARLMQGRGFCREEAERRLSAQRSDEEWRAMADFVIDNSGDPERTEEAVHEICQHIQRL